jgi:hypothetical protein
MIPYGYCHCGCGERTNIPNRTNRQIGYVKGVPMRFVRGHNNRPGPDELPPTERTCTSCGETKALEEFSKNPKKRWGYERHCRRCATAKAKRWAQDNRERDREYRRNRARWLSEDRYDAMRASRSEKLARARGAEIKEWVVPLAVLERDDGVCGICGEDVDPFEYEIDHVVSPLDGGDHSYVNVQLAHSVCNLRKGVQDRERRKAVA